MTRETNASTNGEREGEEGGEREMMMMSLPCPGLFHTHADEGQQGLEFCSKEKGGK